LTDVGWSEISMNHVHEDRNFKFDCEGGLRWGYVQIDHRKETRVRELNSDGTSGLISPLAAEIEIPPKIKFNFLNLSPCNKSVINL
jgi:hypothetical protein